MNSLQSRLRAVALAATVLAGAPLAGLARVNATCTVTNAGAEQSSFAGLQSTTWTGVPIVSNKAQIAPPPCTNNSFMAPMVSPSVMADVRSKVELS